MQHKGRPFRVLYAPRQTAILLFGDDKTGNNRSLVESLFPKPSRYTPSLWRRSEKEKSKNG
jgi:hypothetical protein